MFYELSVLPIFYYVCLKGERKERFQAVYFILFMTFFFSLPFVFFFVKFFLQEKFFVSSLIFLKGEIMVFIGSLMSLFVYLLFLVKIPMYFIHFWLPKAHVEASVGGSIILAALLLKLGCYGILIISSNFFCLMNNVFISFFVVGIYRYIIILFLCLKQRNLKKFVAYSSVFHMSYVIVCSILGCRGV
jgi:NADH:ubiquinone oxidoreductase subunit 4 (subunit M)